MRGSLFASLAGLTSPTLPITGVVVGQTPRPAKPSKSPYTKEMTGCATSSAPSAPHQRPVG
jgi:hypothetical protein